MNHNFLIMQKTVSFLYKSKLTAKTTNIPKQQTIVFYLFKKHFTFVQRCRDVSCLAMHHTMLRLLCSTVQQLYDHRTVLHCTPFTRHCSAYSPALSPTVVLRWLLLYPTVVTVHDTDKQCLALYVMKLHWYWLLKILLYYTCI